MWCYGRGKCGVDAEKLLTLEAVRINPTYKPYFY
jgi:hypothetical protein